MKEPSSPTYLEELAEALFNKHKDHLNQVLFVFPNKRAGIFFERGLQKVISQPIWSPAIQSIDEFVQSLTQLQPATPLELTAKLYDIIQSTQPSNETFERFYPWGITLLQDFDEIAMHQVKANSLFQNLHDQKVISGDLSYLTETQLEAIQSFWKSFDLKLSTHQSNFLALWKILPQVLEKFDQALLKAKKSYRGLQYLTAIKKLEDASLNLPYQSIVLAGFNALSPAEEHLWKQLSKHTQTHFYWDADAYYIEDLRQEAGYYLRKYRKSPLFKESFSTALPANFMTYKNKVQVISSPTHTGQAEILSQELRNLMKEQGDEFDPSKTAIILPDEKLLHPVLYRLPDTLTKINITMGFQLTNTPLYQLIEMLLKLQVSYLDQNNGHFNTFALVPILQHSYLTNVSPHIDKLHSQVFIDPSELVNENELFKVLFKPLSNQEDVLAYIELCIKGVEKAITQQSLETTHFERKSFATLQSEIESLSNLFQSETKTISQDFVKFFRQLCFGVRMPFKNKSLGGLQIMGILETRNLDFDNLFIISMNEGSFPSSVASTSFIPYNLRKGYGLPTSDQHQAAVYAYHFYRLMQRAKNVTLVYANTGNQEEKSRYIWQLLYESKLPIEEKDARFSTSIALDKPIVVEKKGEVLQSLLKCTEQGGRAERPLTPSVFNTYLDCSLRFYFQYVAKISPPLPNTKEIDAMTMGNLFHEVMEVLYKPYLLASKEIRSEDIQSLKKKVVPLLRQVFEQQLPNGRNWMNHGQNVLVFEVLKKLIHRLLTLDAQYAPFKILGLEVGRKQRLYASVALKNGHTVGFKGVIDRVDMKGSQVRVLDYKTGVSERKVPHIASLFDQENSRRNKGALQVIWYGWLFKSQKNNQQGPLSELPSSIFDKDIMPGLFSTQGAFDDHFAPHLLMGNGRNASPLLSNASIEETFLSELKEALETLFDENIPFEQTKDLQRCNYCPYKGICQR